ncbi:hypothetical protein GCM10011578_019650 [Streptomyces fuscichromogenes]|uniref:Uncharacterized protein n=1 Tax=Streptomyces fuscichromogenes TaxID=1324013 RepID=A0A918CQ79_9ACTN|nr:hypothetical protein GCM10011578_019650 [Streptomyces fuscichromogenes]
MGPVRRDSDRSGVLGAGRAGVALSLGGPGKAIVPAMLTGGVTPDRPGDGDPVIMGGLLQVDQGGVAAVDQVLVRQRLAPRQAGVDAGQDLTVVDGGH